MYYFIVNPGANNGHGGRVWKKLEKRLRRSGEEYEVLYTEGPGDASRFAGLLTARNWESGIIVSVGGDGTFNEVLNGLNLEVPVTVGCIPTGTGNDLARSLNLPRSPIRCLKKVLNPQYQRWLDYGVLSYEVGQPVHRRFKVSCGIGLDAAVCQRIAEARSRRRRGRLSGGRLSYVFPGIRQLFTSSPAKGYLVLDGVRKVEFNHIFFVTACIHPYEGGGFKLAPNADGGDGVLEVCVAHNASRLGLLPVLVDAFFGRSGYHRGIRFYSGKELQVHVERPMAVHADGEGCYAQTDIHLRCIEKKIRMIM